MKNHWKSIINHLFFNLQIFGTIEKYFMNDAFTDKDKLKIHWKAVTVKIDSFLKILIYSI